VEKTSNKSHLEQALKNNDRKVRIGMFESIACRPKWNGMENTTKIHAENTKQVSS